MELTDYQYELLERLVHAVERIEKKLEEIDLTNEIDK